MSFANLMLYVASMPKPEKEKPKEIDMSKNNNLESLIGQ